MTSNKLKKTAKKTAKKTKFIFQIPQKKVEMPLLQTDGANIDCVNDFNPLGITLNNHLNWHINKIANKINKTNLNTYYHKMYYLLLSTSLIIPHINYVLGSSSTSNFKTTEKGIRIISLIKYKAHTDPIFKKLQFLKLDDIYKLQQLKFYYKLVNNYLPDILATSLTCKIF